MSSFIRGLTAFALLLPLLFLALSMQGHGPAADVLRMVGAGMALLWIGVWLYSRPTRFEIGQDELRIVWPIRMRRIRFEEIVRVRLLDVRSFRRIYGFTPRIGVGGLWGVYGWLYSRQAGLIDVHASRLDGWVLIERRVGHPVIITPEQPEELAGQLPHLES